MAELINIPGIGKTSLELLEAAGFHDAESLAMAGVAELTRDLERANTILKISKRTPGKSAVGKWIAAARELVGEPETVAAPPVMPVNYEENPQVAAMLAGSPLAIPLPARILVDHQLGVADIPAAILLNRYSGDLDVKVGHRLPGNRPGKPAVSSGNYVKIADHAVPRVEIDTTRMRSTDNMGEPAVKLPAIKASPSNDRVALLRAPLTSTNKGRDPQSKWYIRGVLHTHPVSIYVGAVVTLILMVMVPVAVLAAILLLLSGEMPGGFSWVPAWFLAFPLALPLLGVCYFIWAYTGNCRICGQKLFVHRPHLKNARSHHVRGLGYILPLCAHIILFRWFRCTHCGTPVRLKK